VDLTPSSPRCAGSSWFVRLRGISARLCVGSGHRVTNYLVVGEGGPILRESRRSYSSSAGPRTSSHQVRKLVGVRAATLETAELSMPSFLARYMSR